MRFSIRIKGSAAKNLGRVAKLNRARIVEAIGWLLENPFLGNALKGDLRGLRRLRVGDYRVLYEVRDDALIVLVVRIAHQRDVSPESKMNIKPKFSASRVLSDEVGRRVDRRPRP